MPCVLAAPTPSTLPMHWSLPIINSMRALVSNVCFSVRKSCFASLWTRLAFPESFNLSRVSFPSLLPEQESTISFAMLLFIPCLHFLRRNILEPKQAQRLESLAMIATSAPLSSVLSSKVHAWQNLCMQLFIELLDLLGSFKFPTLIALDASLITPYTLNSKSKPTPFLANGIKRPFYDCNLAVSFEFKVPELSFWYTWVNSHRAEVVLTPWNIFSLFSQ